MEEAKLIATLLLIRHGETSANVEGIIQGQSDYPLTEKGQAQAWAISLALINKKIRKIFTSDLSRAYETALAIKSNHEEAELYSDERLREILLGSRENLPQGTTRENADRIQASRQGIPSRKYQPPPFESSHDVVARVGEFLEEILIDCIKENGNSSTEESKSDASLRTFSSSSDQRDGSLKARNRGSGELDNVPCFAIISHNGALYRMLTEVCGVRNLRKLENCSITTVEAYQSPVNLRTAQSAVPGQQGSGGSAVQLYASAGCSNHHLQNVQFVYKPVKLNDTKHLRGSLAPVDVVLDYA